MVIDKIYTNQKLQGKEDIYFGLREQYFLLASAPESKINFGIDHSKGNFTPGGLNIFNSYPDKHDPALTESGGKSDCLQMGFSGALYFAKIGFRF